MDQFDQPQDMQEGIVAVGRLALHGSGLLGSTFTYAWPVEQAIPFDELLREIDQVECEMNAGGCH